MSACCCSAFSLSYWQRARANISQQPFRHLRREVRLCFAKLYAAPCTSSPSSFLGLHRSCRPGRFLVEPVSAAEASALIALAPV
jgi:hypothetical protein